MIRFGSGSYSVRDSERLNPETVAPPIYRTIVCTVHFLDDTERNFEIDVSLLKNFHCGFYIFLNENLSEIFRRESFDEWWTMI